MIASAVPSGCRSSSAPKSPGSVRGGGPVGGGGGAAAMQLGGAFNPSTGAAAAAVAPSGRTVALAVRRGTPSSSSSSSGRGRSSSQEQQLQEQQQFRRHLLGVNADYSYCLTAPGGSATRASRATTMSPARWGTTDLYDQDDTWCVVPYYYFGNVDDEAICGDSVRPANLGVLDLEAVMCVMMCADHGPCVSGSHNAIVTSRAGKDIVSCLVSGLLTIGPRFGGAIDDAARLFKGACDAQQTPSDFVEGLKKQGIRVSGIGHRIKSKDNRDKRVELLQNYARKPAASFQTLTVTPYTHHQLFPIIMCSPTLGQHRHRRRWRWH
ncbi:ATP-citrate synthase beta chain protein 2 [Tetrabaena socialis]|uniref:ATP-citrate synthase beta chain protein 2 n=1 Tax=Tetrabaena socialis TaxID=47790 RepID=A0A2J7ZKN1_9CHLO|nr:ATP-citrate synthase beta chain protein 2 [Tetrabaena socialis]|eukprot:PNH00823.1 ATP-citrate synthase beta chain protein 2 [Tetrabaena socialis]